MSQKNETVFTCPVCLDKARIKFTKPTFFKTVVVNRECQMCECDFEITLKKPRGAKPSLLVDVSVRLVAVSDYALENHDADGSMRKAVVALKDGPVFAKQEPEPEPKRLTAEELYQAEKERMRAVENL